MVDHRNGGLARLRPATDGQEDLYTFALEAWQLFFEEVRGSGAARPHGEAG